VKKKREEEREMRKCIQEDETNKRKEWKDDDDTSSSSRISIPLILSFPSQHNNHPDDSTEDFDDVDVLPVATTTAFRPIKITPATTTRPLSVASSIPRGRSMSESIDLTLQGSFTAFTWDRENKIANAKWERDNKEHL
jgi:hypothetical protein